MLKKCFGIALVLPLFLFQSFCSADIYNLNVQIVRVYNDAGANPTDLGSAGGADESYLYKTEVDSIWDQAGIQVTYAPTIQWNNTAAQRLSFDERSDIYDNSFAAGTGDAIPGIATDAVQIFFVMDHPGTGYDPNNPGTTGYVGDPLANPLSSARNAGNAELGIAGFTSNGRSVMANEGFASASLADTLSHEIGHLLGLRHVEDVNGGAGNGTTQDPDFMVGPTVPNLMWGAGQGPDYDDLMTLEQNFDLNTEQIAAAIHNGLASGGLQAIPEPASGMAVVLIGVMITMKRRRVAFVNE